MLAPETEALWVPFELTPGNQIRFAMTLNGRAAVAVLDTGVSDTVVSRGFAQAAGLRALLRDRADAIGGAIEIGWAAPRSLAIGGLTRRDGRVAIAELAPIALGDGRPLDVLVGSDILACCALDIDYDAHRFRLLPSGRLPFRGASVPLALHPESHVFVSEVRLAGQRLRPMIVDTGDGSAITLARAAWQAARMTPAAITSTIAFGLGGPIETEVTVLPSIQLGAVNAHDVEVRIEGEAGFSHRAGASGRIGSGLLQRYRVLIDPGAGRMVLAPGGMAADRAAARSTSGLLLAFEGGRLRVLHVMRNSPAALAGWRTGELICAVDGRLVSAAGERAAGWTAGTPGRRVALGMCDGGQRSLVLRQFY